MPTPPRRRNPTLVLVPVMLTALLASPAFADPVPPLPSGAAITNGVDTVADSAVVPSPSVADTASGAIDTVTDAVSGATDTVSGATDTVSGATDTVSGAAGQQAGAAATAGEAISTVTGGGAARSGAAEAVRERSTTSLGAAPGAGRRTATRQGGEAVPCDPQTGPCAPPSSGGPLADALGRILGFLAQTGIGLMGWIALAVGLGALGAYLVGSSRSRKAHGRATASSRS